MLSTPVLDAASISITSKALPDAIERHNSQLPQGSGVGSALAMQFSDRAKILALEVLPVPLGPVKRYAGAMRPVLRALLRVVAIASWPTSWLNRWGLYLWCSGS